MNLNYISYHSLCVLVRVFHRYTSIMNIYINTRTKFLKCWKKYYFIRQFRIHRGTIKFNAVWRVCNRYFQFVNIKKYVAYNIIILSRKSKKGKTPTAYQLCIGGRFRGATAYVRGGKTCYEFLFIYVKKRMRTFFSRGPLFLDLWFCIFNSYSISIMWGIILDSCFFGHD